MPFTLRNKGYLTIDVHVIKGPLGYAMISVWMHRYMCVKET